MPRLSRSSKKNIHVFFVFCFFSILGTLARLGVTLLSEYPGTYLRGIVWSNFTSCLLMGMISSSDKLWSWMVFKKNDPIIMLIEENEGKTLDMNYTHYKTKKDLYLFTGLTTGFCGSFSSFSSLILELFLYTANIETTYYNFRNPAYGLLQFLSTLIAQLSLSQAGFVLGKNIIEYIEEEYIIDAHFDKKWVKIHDKLIYLIEFLGISFMIVSLVLTIIKKTWRSWTLAFLFCPFACYLRYNFAQKLNHSPIDHPLNWKHVDYMGTLASNILACLVLAIVTILYRGKKTYSSNHLINNILDCHVLTAFVNGFCGVLSTVSTFMVEVNSLKFDRSFWYIFVSMFTCFSLMVLIVGSYNWTVGLLPSPVC